MLSKSQLDTMKTEAWRDPDAEVSMFLLDLIREYEELQRLNAQLLSSLHRLISVVDVPRYSEDTEAVEYEVKYSKAILAKAGGVEEEKEPRGECG